MFLYTALLLILGAFYVSAHQSYISLIPNGGNVLYITCSNTTIDWFAVGHVSAEYTGSPFLRNRFGEDFAAANHTWTTELCNADSDSDGVTNGDELGFPDCSLASDWNDSSSSVTLIEVWGHPGICEQNPDTPADVNCDTVNTGIPDAICN